jgi:protein-S-isoprenylcysteine O-methyltransferase Ste14
MELQTVAQSQSALKDWKHWIRLAVPFLAQEGLLISGLMMASPTHTSAAIGAGFSFVGYVFLFWVQGYKSRAIIGPYRFVRHPKQLGLWLLSMGFAIACRSFPATVLSLLLLPCLFYLGSFLRNEEPDLKTYRYRYHVPALLPTLLPFKKDGDVSIPFEWRRAVFPTERAQLHALGSVLYGWVALGILSNFILPPWTNWLLIGLWLLALLGFRLVISTKNTPSHSVHFPS